MLRENAFAGVPQAVVEDILRKAKKKEKTKKMELFEFCMCHHAIVFEDKKFRLVCRQLTK